MVRLLSIVSFLVLLPAVGIAQPPKVLAENFNNTNCGNCKTPDEQFEAFMTKNPSLGIVRINYHNEITNPNDTFYVASQLFVAYRSGTFYSVSFNPYCVINGQSGANSEPTWEALSKSKALSAPGLTVNAYMTVDGLI